MTASSKERETMGNQSKEAVSLVKLYREAGMQLEPLEFLEGIIVTALLEKDLPHTIHHDLHTLQD